jgi:hypothetical protein
MGMSQTATILALLDEDVLVELNGRNRLVSNLLVPDIRVGDQVVIGGGRVVSRSPSADSTQLRALHATMANPARTAPPRRRHSVATASAVLRMARRRP